MNYIIYVINISYSCSMEHTLSRYSRGLEMDYPQHSSDDLAVEVCYIVVVTFG